MIHWKWMDQCVVHFILSNESNKPSAHIMHVQLFEKAHTLLKCILIMCNRENMKHLYRKKTETCLLKEKSG